MAATPVPDFSPPPDFPVLSDRAAGTYNSKAYAVATFWQTTLGPNVRAIAYTAYLNAQEANSQADVAVSAGTQAASAAATAVAAANFKGNWSDLAGALNMPACVRHSGRFWVLLANLANVTAAVPGVSASWAALDAGTVPSQKLAAAGATVNAVVGVRYLVAANNVTVNIPTGLLKGDYHGVRWMSGFSGGVWAFGAVPLRRMAVGSLTVDTPLFGLDVFYEDATEGLI